MYVHISTVIYDYSKLSVLASLLLLMSSSNHRDQITPVLLSTMYLYFDEFLQLSQTVNVSFFLLLNWLSCFPQSASTKVSSATRFDIGIRSGLTAKVSAILAPFTGYRAGCFVN